MKNITILITVVFFGSLFTNSAWAHPRCHMVVWTQLEPAGRLATIETNLQANGEYEVMYMNPQDFTWDAVMARKNGVAKQVEFPNQELPNVSLSRLYSSYQSRALTPFDLEESANQNCTDFEIALLFWVNVKYFN